MKISCPRSTHRLARLFLCGYINIKDSLERAFKIWIHGPIYSLAHKSFQYHTDVINPLGDGLKLSYYKTRRHSSRMRTARLLPVSPSMHCSGGCTCQRGVYLPAGGGVPEGVGGVPARGVPAQVPPLCEQNDRQVQKYYLAPNFVCGR